MPSIRRNFLRLGYTAAISMVVALLAAGTARASFIETVVQSGSDLVVTGSGTIDLTDLSTEGTFGPYVTEIVASAGIILTGEGLLGDKYSGLTGPTSFGDASLAATSGSGDLVGVVGLGDLVVPWGYVSGHSLSSTSTFPNPGPTFPDIGLTPGTYTWTWGTGDHADSFILKIGVAAVPEPGSLALFGTGVLVTGVLRRRRKL